MMSNTVPKNCSSEVHNKPDSATLANSQEKLRLTMICVASRAHSYCWKMNDDTKDSFPALLDSSLDDMEHVYHLCGIYDKNIRKFIAKDMNCLL